MQNTKSILDKIPFDSLPKIWIDPKIRQNPNINKDTLWLIFSLSLIINRKENSCTPTISQLCKITGYSKNTLKEIIQQMVNAGWLEVVERLTQSGDRTSNQYILKIKEVGFLVFEAFDGVEIRLGEDSNEIIENKTECVAKYVGVGQNLTDGGSKIGLETLPSSQPSFLSSSIPSLQDFQNFDIDESMEQLLAMTLNVEIPLIKLAFICYKTDPKYLTNPPKNPLNTFKRWLQNEKLDEAILKTKIQKSQDAITVGAIKLAGSGYLNNTPSKTSEASKRYGKSPYTLDATNYKTKQIFELKKRDCELDYDVKVINFQQAKELWKETDKSETDKSEFEFNKNLTNLIDPKKVAKINVDMTDEEKETKRQAMAADLLQKRKEMIAKRNKI